MKKLLLTFSFAAILLSAKAQIVVTGIMADPGGTDASATAGVKAYEYAQFKATQNIDFAVTPFSVVFLYETTTTPLPDNSWASGSQGLTYQMNLNSGTVAKGEYFYVGGDGLKIWGGSSTDISAAKWIRSIDYAKNTGDSGNGTSKTGLLGNSTRANGIAVFAGTSVLATTVPIDVVFFGGIGSNHYSAGPPEKGYRITTNDLYKIADGDFFAKSANTNTIPVAAAADLGKFMQLGGVYDLQNNVWSTNRSVTLVTLTNSSTLADIESGAGATVLPVQLTSFTAKASKQGAVNLAWSTASEKDNSHFEVTRSTNGVDFEKLDEVKGNGNSDVVRNYSYTDKSPAAGANYYRLKQVDTDGKFAFSNVATAKVGLSSENLSVSVSSNRASVAVTYNALSSGKASFNIYNVSGAKIATVEQTVNAGANQINIPVALSNSLHILKVSQAGATASTKF